MEGLGDAAYQSLDQATYTGARFDGIYNDANLTGSLMALAVLVGTLPDPYRTETVGAICGLLSDRTVRSGLFLPR